VPANPIRSATVLSITCIVLALALMLWLMVSLSADSRLAREHVVRLLAADGAHTADARFETVTSSRARARTGSAAAASTTMALLRGTYSLYAAANAAEDDVIVDVVDRGSGVFVGRYTLSGARSHGTLVVSTASILSFTLKPQPRTAARQPPYEVVMALVGPLVER
jgi:hypothetical protein